MDSEEWNIILQKNFVFYIRTPCINQIAAYHWKNVRCMTGVVWGPSGNTFAELHSVAWAEIFVEGHQVMIIEIMSDVKERGPKRVMPS